MGILSETPVFAVAMDAIVDRFNTAAILTMPKIELLTLAELVREILCPDN